jgi:hypothetical protein
MKRVTMGLAAAAFGLLIGCTGGVEFNGAALVDQFPIRTTPISHHVLPAEVRDPLTGEYELDITPYNQRNINVLTFIEQPSPGHDLWAQHMLSYQCSDNPTCRTPAEVPDWFYIFSVYQAQGPSGLAWPPGGSWPHPQVNTASTPDRAYIAAWILSFQNQWFLRDLDGTRIDPIIPGAPPVIYETVGFASMPISIHETNRGLVGNGGSGFTPLLANNPPAAAQQETGDPVTTGANNKARVETPVNNVVSWAFNGNGMAEGVLAMAWREHFARNIHIETNVSTGVGGTPIGNNRLVMQEMPAPDYFGAAGPVSSGGGVFLVRFVNQWWQSTDGNPVTLKEDGLRFAYYAAAVGNHLIGYGVGLIDNSFASKGGVTDQEDIMNLSVVLDMSAFIATGKEFQFTVEDLLRMQDVVSGGTFESPGPRSTLPGTHRK